MSKVTSVEDYKLESNFQHLRKILLDDAHADRLDKPLAYWALPNDRRLPLAFLGRTLGDLLGTSFPDLAATPGIGQKKIGSLMKLLSRATREMPPSAVYLGDSDKKGAAVDRAVRGKGDFDPTAVSEAVWVRWRETVKQHAIAQEKLGHLAPTLQALPTVIWHTPLATYCDMTLAEIRALKTHGEKRVRVILEVFFTVHQMLSQLPPSSHLAISVRPKFAVPLEQWIADVLQRREPPSVEEVRTSLAIPLIEQLEADTGNTISRLAEGRLGLSGAPQSVRQQSKRLGVTRARVYQLLEECNKVMSVRWPEGEALMRQLAAAMNRSGSEPGPRMLVALADLFYPQGELSSLEAA